MMSFGRKQGAVVRSFVAIAVPEPVRVACAAQAVELAGRPAGDAVRWVHTGNYHVTLRFFGNVDAERLPELVSELGRAAAAVPAFELSLGPPHPFPPGRRAKVVALSLQPEAQLLALAEEMERAAQAVGLEPETRRFHAHLTLGRIRNRRLPRLDGLHTPPPPPWPVREIVLYRSDLERAGARYTPLAHCPLDAVGASPEALARPGTMELEPPRFESDSP